MTRLSVFAALILTGCQGNAAPTTAVAAAPAPEADKKAPAKKNDPGTITVAHDVAWMKAMLDLGEALVHSNPMKAKGMAGSAVATNPPKAVADLLADFPTDLKAQRSRFGKLSAEARKLWEADAALQKGTAVMHCPMVPADWIQPAGKLRNPYMPETMLRCGYQVKPTK